MTERKFTQIALTFEDGQDPTLESIPAKPTSKEEVAENKQPEAAPVNVGFRIKALKEAAAPPTAPVEPRPAKPVAKPKSTRGRKSLKESEADAALVAVPEDEILFQKQYYSIGEVAAMFAVNTSLIRYWANEFDMIQPRKNRKGDRHFRPVDIKNLLLIHELLRRKKLTIEGAKDFLKKNKKAQERFELIESLRKIRNLFLEIRAGLQ
ncbi:MAG: hypothetical protein RL732_816 [Bacteroidota bacterium]|jgi:DNA-binding transcriptional MerR regulator